MTVGNHPTEITWRISLQSTIQRFINQSHRLYNLRCTWHLPMKEREYQIKRYIFASFANLQILRKITARKVTL